MFEKLKRFLAGDPSPVAGQIQHPVLGCLSWSADEEAWLSDPGHSKIGFAFHITGTPHPHENLVSYAEEIARNPGTFAAIVAEFLVAESDKAKHLHSYAVEVATLQIESLCLFWPDRPSDGMIYFTGGQDYGIWRCDFINGHPTSLGFDS